jgi:hypothetical protein
MIRFLRHHEIDKSAWDARLLRCPNRLWYAQSWVLDHASPGWEALVDEESEAMMPLCSKRKWGIDYLHQPLGLQQLGTFAVSTSHELHRAFLVAARTRFRFIDIMLNEAMPGALVDEAGIEARENQVLHVNAPHGVITSRYGSNHQRNLKEAGVGLNPLPISVDAFELLFRATTGQRFGPDALKGFGAFMTAVAEGIARGQCRIVALGEGENVCAAACFADWEGRSILLKSANTTQGHTRKAMFRIVDDWINTHAGTGTLLDFAGSRTPGTARFNKGFGAVDRAYFRLRANRLPIPIRWLKR